jgi:hypothetical protein
VDNSTFVGSSSSGAITSFDPNTLVFNEIGLFSGTSNLFNGDYTTDITEVDNFVSQTPNYSVTENAKSKMMLTHVIFHPIQKSANRSLEIIYTLRIQMGVS